MNLQLMRAAIVSAVVVLAASACAGGQHRQPASSAAPSGSQSTPRSTQQGANKPLVQVWQTKVNGFGSALSIGKSTVLITSRGQQLYATALASESGRFLWQHEISPGDVPSGMAVEISQVAGHVVYLAPNATQDTGALGAQLVVADPVSGKALVTTAPYDFLSTPSECDEVPKSICVHASIAGTDVALILRPGSDQLVPDIAGGTQIQHRDIGPDGLSDLLTRSPEQIAVIRKGKVAWQHPLSQLFGASRSTDFGWQFEKASGSGVFVGSVGWTGYQDQSSDGAISLAKASITAGFRASDGAPLWRDAGTSIFCNDQLSIPAPQGSDLPDFPVRCRNSGQLVRSASGAEPDTKNLSVTLEGFDPASGKTTWSVPLGDAPALLGARPDAQPSQLDDRRMLVPTEHGQFVVDLKTGATRPISATDVAWCATRPTLSYAVPQLRAGSQSNERYGEDVMSPCAPSGAATTALPTATPSDGRTDIAGGLQVVVSTGAVTAYRRG